MTDTFNKAQPDTLLSASLLAAVGGLLDAAVFVLHGHVFANALTGNVILFGITLVQQNYPQALRHLAPIVAFIFGVAASRLLRTMPQFHASLAVLILEMAVLFAAGLAPTTFPETIFTATIAFVSAFQVSTFRTVGRFAYNSTFVTGNVREISEGFANCFLHPDADVRRREFAKSRKLTIICVLFLAGALLGAWAAPHLGNRALWLAEPLLLATLARVLWLQTHPEPEEDEED
jgi:uncharacterized membrane protein YoaK (UPF0700 family)